MDSSSRRSFLSKAALGTLSVTAFTQAQESTAGSKSDARERVTSIKEETTQPGVEHCVTEWVLHSAKVYSDPFNDVELDVVLTDPQGRAQRVPSFWRGENVWSVRYAPHSAGRYSYRTICSDPQNADLHDRTGVLEIAAYQGSNPLLKHGPIRVASDRLHFEHADGTPFFWLGDWVCHGLRKALRWPEDFQTLMVDREKKGFTVIQIVGSSLLCDMVPFDPRGYNEGGYSWEPNFARINPMYFDMADLRIQYLVDHGLVPCVVGCWGWYLPIMGVEKIKKHWRYIIARWGAYPVIWCLAGEGAMEFYRSKDREKDVALQKRGWTEVGKYVRSTDPFHNLVTIHPSVPPSDARDNVEDESVLDFNMLQTGHEDVWSIPNTVNVVTRERAREPHMPVVVGEVTFEGHKQQNRQQVVRFMFWSSILGGTAGHTYGAGGIWEIQTATLSYGASPWGGGYGDLPWQIAYRYPGSEQVGWGKELLTLYEWWRLEPHPEWVEPHWTKDHYLLPYAAGIPGELRIVYIPLNMRNLPKITRLEPDVTYDPYWFRPATGQIYPVKVAPDLDVFSSLPSDLVAEKERPVKVVPDAGGAWQVPRATYVDDVDWVLVLENRAKVKRSRDLGERVSEAASCQELRPLLGW